ncbi:MAG: hypothetical protein GF401_17570 [Chitinivibrionales bacterium]|nr:hypothetical protein [Chitinivibrionales bacterium]
MRYLPIIFISSLIISGPAVSILQIPYGLCYAAGIEVSKMSSNEEYGNGIIEKFNNEIQKDRPNFEALKGFIETMTRVSMLKTEEMSQAYKKKNETVSKEIMGKVEKALSRENVDDAEKELAYYQKYRDELEIPFDKVVAYRGKIQQLAGGGVSAKDIEDDLSRTEDFVYQNRIGDARNLIQLLDSKIDKMDKKEQSRYSARLERIKTTVETKTDSLINSVLEVLRSEGKEAAVDYRKKIAAETRIADAEFASIDNAIVQFDKKQQLKRQQAQVASQEEQYQSELERRRMEKIRAMREKQESERREKDRREQRRLREEREQARRDSIETAKREMKRLQREREQARRDSIEAVRKEQERLAELREKREKARQDSIEAAREEQERRAELREEREKARQDSIAEARRKLEEQRRLRKLADLERKRKEAERQRKIEKERQERLAAEKAARERIESEREAKLAARAREREKEKELGERKKQERQERLERERQVRSEADKQLAEKRRREHEDQRRLERERKIYEEKTKKSLIVIYELVEQGRVSEAYRKFNREKNELQKYLYPEAYDVLQMTVNQSYADMQKNEREKKLQVAKAKTSPSPAAPRRSERNSAKNAPASRRPRVAADKKTAPRITESPSKKKTYKSKEDLYIKQIRSLLKRNKVKEAYLFFKRFDRELKRVMDRDDFKKLKERVYTGYKYYREAGGR